MELYNQLLVEKVDESFLKIHCLQHVKLLLSEYFKITPPNVDGMRFGMSKNWDGKISLFDGRSKKLPIGLFPYLIDFAKDNDLKLITEGMNWYLKPKKITDDDLRPFIKFLNLPFVPYKYQVEALRSTISNQRRTFLSPTSSGKSLIAYMLVRFFKDKKILLICPTINLVRQMAGDWKEYSEENGWDTDADTHQIAEGASRESDKRIHISTWQALQNMPKDFFHQYDTVIGERGVRRQAANRERVVQYFYIQFFHS